MDTRTEQLIELFFANDLSETETQELRSLLANNPAAAAEFSWQQSLAGRVSRLSLAGSIQNEQWKQASRPPFRQVTMWKKMLAAAAAIAVLVTAWILLSPEKMESVVAGNYVHYPNKMPFRSLGGPGDSSGQVPQAVLDAFRLYDNADRPADAARALAEIAAAYPDRLDYRFYQGVALIADGRYPEAAGALRPVADSDDVYHTPALYYLGLAYAGSNNKEQARAALQAYLNTTDEVLTYREQAENVLNALD
jgi:tetratricopeptide (TPR) repeat protein